MTSDGVVTMPAAPQVNHRLIALVPGSSASLAARLDPGRLSHGRVIGTLRLAQCGPGVDLQ